MATIYDIPPAETIKKASEELKKELAMPAWAHFVKTAPSKQRHPMNQDWYFMRAASILRKIYRFGPIGTNKLRRKYGSKKDRGHRRERNYPASGKIIRSIIQQLEKKGYVKNETKGVHKGRIITPKGKSFLDKISNPKKK